MGRRVSCGLWLPCLLIALASASITAAPLGLEAVAVDGVELDQRAARGRSAAAAHVRTTAALSGGRLFLPLLVQRHPLRAVLELRPTAAMAEVGQDTWFELWLSGATSARSLTSWLIFWPEHVFVVDEDGRDGAVQVGRGEACGPDAYWSSQVSNTWGYFAVLCTTYHADSLDDGLVARFRLHAKEPGELDILVSSTTLVGLDGAPAMIVEPRPARLVIRSPPPTPAPGACAAIPGERYGRLSILGAPLATPAAAQPDVNLARRGAEPSDAYRGLVDYAGGTDSRAPQLAGLLAAWGNRDASIGFSRTWRVREWDWAGDRPAGVVPDWPATLVGVAVAPGEPLRLPASGYGIGDGYQALVLYSAPGRVTLKYTREDNVVYGYTLHVEGVCVEPGLQALYDQSVAEGRRRLPALRARQAFGRAAAAEVRFAIRDTGRFMDPRSRKDWWVGR